MYNQITMYVCEHNHNTGRTILQPFTSTSISPQQSKQTHHGITTTMIVVHEHPNASNLHMSYTRTRLRGGTGEQAPPRRWAWEAAPPTMLTRTTEAKP